MKNRVKFGALALALALAAALASGHVAAQTAGSVLVRAGLTRLTPAGPSQCMSAPAFSDAAGACAQTDVSADTQLAGGVSYMVSNHVSVDVPLALPFKHPLSGAGALQGVGRLGEVQVLPVTVFLQYRLLEANAKLRPYVGVGATYAYFFSPQGSGRLTALTNPGGVPTTFTVESKLVLTPQIGATLAVSDKWWVDVVYSKSKLNTRTQLSTGQTIAADLDPGAFSIALAYKF